MSSQTALTRAQETSALIEAWLSQFGRQPERHWDPHQGDDRWHPSLPPSHTQRAYRTHIYRFAVWAAAEREKSILTITTEDCEAYLSFVQDPAPSERWRGRNKSGHQPLFRGPLRGGALKSTFYALKGFYNFLQQAGWIAFNPWSAIRPPKQSPSGAQSQRSLSEFWPVFEDVLNGLEGERLAHRVALAVHILTAIKIRLHQLVNMRLGDVVPIPTIDRRASDHQWALLVADNKFGELGLHSVQGAVMAAIRATFEKRGLVIGDPGVAEQYLFAQTHLPLKAISADSLRREIAEFLSRCAKQVAFTDPDSAAEFTILSHWWLRSRASKHLDLDDHYDRARSNMKETQRIWRNRSLLSAAK